MVVGLAAAAWVVAVTWMGTLPPGFSLAARDPADAALLLTASLAALGIGLTDWARDPGSRRGVALALAGVTWPLSAGANPGAGSSLIFTLCLALPYACAPFVTLVGAQALRGTTRSRGATTLLALSWLGPVALAGVAPQLFFQPAAEGCRSCPANLLGLLSVPDLSRAIRDVGLVLTAIGCGLIVIWLLARFTRATAPARAAAMPVFAPAVAVLVIVAINGLAALPKRESWPNESLWRACSIALFATALGVVIAWWRTQITRQRIARLAVEIADSPRPGGLRALLADQLRDPGLVVAYAVGDGRTVDSDGRTVELAGGPGRQLTTITRDGVVVARLEHRQSLADDPERLDEVVRACRLALENERLQAASRARLQELRASRALVVETGDAARQRLERDLHDGAQQRLVSLALALRMCRTSLIDADAPQLRALDSAEQELRRAIDELRTVAHGLYPQVLAEEGLAAGIDALRESSSVPFRIDAMPAERLPHPVEAAAWFAIEEATHGLENGHVTLSVRRLDGRLLVDMEHDGPFAPELVDVEDRIGALDGTLRVVTVGGGISRLHAEIPCAS